MSPAVLQETGYAPEHGDRLDGPRGHRTAHVGRRTFYAWKPRFLAGGYAALQQFASRAPKTTRRTPLAIEQQVIEMIASGCLNKEVAQQLGISEVTVKAHRASAYRKMQARSFAQLVQMIIKVNPRVAAHAVPLRGDGDGDGDGE